MHIDKLEKPIMIHVCKDRTLSYRTKKEKVFNGVALPVFSVNTKEEAETLVRLVGSKQYEEHPLLPGQDWLKINIGFKQYLEYDDLAAVTEKLENAYALINH